MVGQEVCQGAKLSLKGFKVVMEFTHEFLVKVFAQGVTSLKAVKVHDISRVLINHPHILHQPLLKVGGRVPWDVCRELHR